MTSRIPGRPERRSRGRRSISILLPAALLVFALAGPAAADEGTVTVVHGVPELTVDEEGFRRLMTEQRERAKADADAELDPSAREDVDGGHLLGHPHRGGELVGHQAHPEAEADLLRDLGESAEHDLGRRGV